MIKGLIQQDITLVNIYTSNIKAPKYIKQVLMDMKGGINNNTAIVKNFNTSSTSMDRSFRQKINKESVALKDTLDQMNLNGIFRAFRPKPAEYTYFSRAHGMIFRIDHMLGHKQVSINLRRLKSYQASSLSTVLLN